MRYPHRWLALGCLLGQAFAQTFAPLVRPYHVGNPAAFDTVRRRLVMFGEDGTTWELDGGELLSRTPETGVPQPTPRRGHALCYDEARRRVLMFGGLGGLTAPLLNETWVYDGAGWAQLTAGPAPPGRQRAAMTWDSARTRAVMWGGFDASFNLLSDTWEHDGITWLQRSPATSPGGRPGTMVFDRQRSVAVLVTQSAAAPPVETWEWNGTDWALRATINIVAGTQGALTMAYDPARNRTVLAGATDRLHEWDGVTWTPAPLPQPFVRSHAASWFDPTCGCVILAGGLEPATGASRADRWRWNGQLLTPLQMDVGPRMSAGVMFSDPLRQRVVHFGGLAGFSYSGATWAMVGDVWSAVASPTSPTPRAGATATHDLIRGEGLLFGGYGPVDGMLGDTWSLGSTGWVARSIIGPPPRMNAAMAADLVRGVVVLFGGIGNVVLDDTWEWDGTQWTQRATAIQPPARLDAAMAFHQALGGTLLFGGQAASQVRLNDTWMWNGSQWTQLSPTTVPPPLTHVSMSSDLSTAQSILVGVAGPSPALQQVWRHDGSNWLLQASDPFVGLALYPCVPRAALDSVVCLRSSAPAAAELTLTPGRVATIGAGCGTPASTLLVRSRPRIGTATGFELVANPARAMLFGLDLASGNTPLGGGCTVWLSPGFLGLFQISNASGFAEQPLLVPANPGLRGLDLFAQAAVLEPLSSNGLVLTQGLRLTLGD